MYFVKFASLDPVNPTFAYTSYSTKFTLNGMIGTFNSTVQAQISCVASSPTASTPAAAAGTTTTPGASATAKTTAVASAASAAKSASATPTANGAIGVTAPGVVSSTIGLGMVMSFAGFFLGALAFCL